MVKALTLVPGKRGENDVKCNALVSVGLLPYCPSEYDAEKVIELNKTINSYTGIVLAAFFTKYYRTVPNYDPTGNDYRSKIVKSLKSSGSSILMNIGSKVSNDADGFKENLTCMGNALNNYWNEGKSNKYGTIFKCDGTTTPENCKIAKAKLLTYKADFYQTEQYHQLGSQFAKQNCSSNALDPFGAGACKALNAWRSNKANDQGIYNPVTETDKAR